MMRIRVGPRPTTVLHHDHIISDLPFSPRLSDGVLVRCVLLCPLCRTLRIINLMQERLIMAYFPTLYCDDGRESVTTRPLASYERSRYTQPLTLDLFS